MTLPFIMPPGLSGTLWAQVAIDDPAAVFGIAFSNAVKGTIP